MRRLDLPVSSMAVCRVVHYGCMQWRRRMHPVFLHVRIVKMLRTPSLRVAFLDPLHGFLLLSIVRWPSVCVGKVLAGPEGSRCSRLFCPVRRSGNKTNGQVCMQAGRLVGTGGRNTFIIALREQTKEDDRPARSYINQASDRTSGERGARVGRGEKREFGIWPHIQQADNSPNGYGRWLVRR